MQPVNQVTADLQYPFPASMKIDFRKHREDGVGHL